MGFDAATYYDQYWRDRNRERTRARSHERALATLQLLGDPRGRRLVEIGCGPGWALEIVQDAGYRVHGVEVSEVAVDEARGRGLEIQRADIEAGSLRALFGEDKRPTVVVALEVLEHLLDPHRALQNMRQLLADDGLLVVSLPNEIPLSARLRILCGRLPFGGHHDPHVRHFDRRRARELCESTGCRIVREVPLSVLPPRWRLPRLLLQPLVKCLPGAFTLSTVYLLRSDSHES